MFTPYVGVTGFMTRAEVETAIAKFDTRQGLRAKRLLMVGVLVSNKTLSGVTNKWPHRYPRYQDLSELMLPHRRVVNLIHFATDDKDHLTDHMNALRTHGGPDLDGFQLNIPWPDPKRIVTGFPRMVLQIGARAMEMEGNDPDRIADRLNGYRGCITEVLIDASSGHGIPLDLQKTEGYLRAIVKKHPTLGIGIAGGLPGVSLDRLKDLVRAFPFVSIDAESGLRDANDHLEMKSVNDYFVQADKLMPYARKAP